MFKSLCKNFISQCGRKDKNHVKLGFFSTKLAPEESKMEDWQYVQKISKQIKNNDVNQALKLLIQSHLNKQILNRQIYYTFQQKVQQLSLSIDYQQLLYKLYRQHFQPNSMTLNWMKKISKTQNQKLLQLLKEDYAMLKQSFPINTTVLKQESKAKSIKSNFQKMDQQGKTHVGRKSRKVPTIPSTDEYFSKSPDAILVSKKQRAPKQFHQKNAFVEQSQKPTIQVETVAQISTMLQNMFKQYGKVTLHDVELVMEEEDYSIDEEMNEMYNEGQQFDNEDQQQTVEDYILQMLTSITKVKIGRIELHNPHFLEQISKKLKGNDQNDKQKN